jgi:hypothetical protein
MARPLIPTGQSFVTFFDERHSPVRRRQAKISQVFGRFPLHRLQTRLTRQTRLIRKGHSVSFTRPTRPCVNPFVASATREVLGEHGR